MNDADYELIYEKVKLIFEQNKLDSTESVVVLMEMVCDIITASSEPEAWFKHVISGLFLKMHKAHTQSSVDGMVMQ